MSDLDNTDAAALELPASEPAPVEKEIPRELPVAEETEAEAEVEATDDEDELDFGFRKYRVPKSLKEGVEALRADYTQKTQGASARQAELDARAVTLDQQSKATDTELNARAQMIDIDQKLKAYDNVDWVRFAGEDPVGAQQHRLYFEQLRQTKDAAKNTITEAEQARTQKSQQDIAKRFEEAKAYATSKIPGWSEDTNTKLMKFVTEEGVPLEFIRDNMSPTLVKLLHKAWLGDQAQKRQAAAPLRAASPPIEPLQTVAAVKAPATRLSLAQMAEKGDMEAYAAARHAGRTR